MKLLILGATGRTGKHVLALALERGYKVKCLVRDPSKISTSSNVTIIQGDPTNDVDLELALKDNEAVISVLNVSRMSDFPWAPLRSPKTFMSDVMSNIITLSKKYSLKRVVVCSAWGVSETRKDIPFWFRWLIDLSNIGAAYKDHERQEKIIENSSLDWTIVRPVGLTNTDKHQMAKESFDNVPKPELTINRKTVARYLLESLERDTLVRKKVVISGN